MFALRHMLEIAGFGLLSAAAIVALYDSYWLWRHPDSGGALRWAVALWVALSGGPPLLAALALRRAGRR